jgi:transposase-like protein
MNFAAVPDRDADRAVTLMQVRADARVANTIWKWVKQARLDVGERKDGLTTDEKVELARLRRENRVLREERDTLSKAAAWFAQEAAPTPKKRSDS